VAQSSDEGLMIHRYFRAASWAVMCFVLCANPRAALASSDPFIGEVDTFAFNFCPLGWSTLNGQLLPINQNTPLFSLLGTTYGGDGKTTFALPTAKPIFTATGAVLLQCIAIQGVFPSRN
jgi:microcystin-dependent protein